MSKTHVHGEEVPEAEKIQPCSTVVFLLSRCRFKNSLLNLPLICHQLIFMFLYKLYNLGCDTGHFTNQSEQQKS